MNWYLLIINRADSRTPSHDIVCRTVTCGTALHVSAISFRIHSFAHSGRYIHIFPGYFRIPGRCDEYEIPHLTFYKIWFMAGVLLYNIIEINIWSFVSLRRLWSLWFHPVLRSPFWEDTVCRSVYGCCPNQSQLHVSMEYLCCAPVGWFLEVEELVSRTVDVGYVFAVGIVDNPGLSWQTFSILIQQIHFGDTSQVFPSCEFKASRQI